MISPEKKLFLQVQEVYFDSQEGETSMFWLHLASKNDLATVSVLRQDKKFDQFLKKWPLGWESRKKQQLFYSWKILLEHLSHIFLIKLGQKSLYSRCSHCTNRVFFHLINIRTASHENENKHFKNGLYYSEFEIPSETFNGRMRYSEPLIWKPVNFYSLQSRSNLMI